MRPLHLVLALLLLPGAAAAQQAPAPPAGDRGYLLYVADPQRLLSTAPLVLVSEASAAARRLSPLDGGVGVDVVAGDRIFSAAIEAEFVHPGSSWMFEAAAVVGAGTSPPGRTRRPRFSCAWSATA